MNLFGKSSETKTVSTNKRSKLELLPELEFKEAQSFLSFAMFAAHGDPELAGSILKWIAWELPDINFSIETKKRLLAMNEEALDNTNVDKMLEFLGHNPRIDPDKFAAIGLYKMIVAFADDPEKKAKLQGEFEADLPKLRKSIRNNEVLQSWLDLIPKMVEYFSIQKKNLEKKEIERVRTRLEVKIISYLIGVDYDAQKKVTYHPEINKTISQKDGPEMYSFVCEYVLGPESIGNAQLDKLVQKLKVAMQEVLKAHLKHVKHDPFAGYVGMDHFIELDTMIKIYNEKHAQNPISFEELDEYVKACEAKERRSGNDPDH